MGGERGKKTIMQNEQLILKNILNYEIYQLKPKQTASFAKSTDTDAKLPAAHNSVNKTRIFIYSVKPIQEQCFVRKLVLCM